MSRFCYCSKLLPGKVDLVRHHWQQKEKILTPEIEEAEEKFWNHLTMTGFDSWLQKTAQGDFIVHCLEGESLAKIFQGLRQQIQLRNGIALKLQEFYLNILGKDYSSPDIEPKIEKIMDISLPTSASIEKRAFFLPLLPGKVEEQVRFKKEAMTTKRERYEESMRAFGLSHLSSWLQTTPTGHYLITYSEKNVDLSTSSQVTHSKEWQEISTLLMDHTGLTVSELHPDVEHLTSQ